MPQPTNDNAVVNILVDGKLKNILPPTNETWEEKCGDLLEGFANELGNLIVERINDRITSQQFDFTGCLLRQAAMNGFSDLFSEERKRAQEEVFNMIKLPEHTHESCPIKESCIGYQNAESDLYNLKLEVAQSLGLSIKE